MPTNLVKKPNILLAISDDQSWPFASAYGCKYVHTPAFDRVAREGVLFTHAYCPAPQCSPSRAALLTGRNIWQIEEAGTHASSFPRKYKVYPELLEAAGYFVGYTGKPWGPGNWEVSRRTRNPAGPGYLERKNTTPTTGINQLDYAANFNDFLKAKPEDQPFCFWFGCKEPHRAYEKGSGLRAGKRTEDVMVPPFLPDNEEIRSDLLDYAVEIEWYDLHLGRMLQRLEELGELDNTLIVVTSDNGMPFPRSKANLYELSTHVPFAIRWGAAVPGGRISDAFVSFIDLAPTFLEAAGLVPPREMTGHSLLPLLIPQEHTRYEEREYVLTGRERHSHARINNLGYPVRAIRTKTHLYIQNFKPERWPAGDPDGYYDVDSSPSKTFMIEHQKEEGVRELFELAFAKRPAEELYALEEDPMCLRNLAMDPESREIKDRLRLSLERELIKQKDPRMLGYGDIFESYPRYSPLRENIKGSAEQGEYNADFF